jgi:CO/xanthine dehydrogenase FAD-binding subunit
MAIQQFYLAQSVDEALSQLAKSGEGAQLTAGGTDVMVKMRNGSLGPEKNCLIDIGRIPDLSFIKESENGLTIEIGSCTTHTTLAADELASTSSLILDKACRSVGSPQIRNRGTIGGNVLTAAQCADSIPALLVLDAELVLRDTRGSERTLPIRDFFPGPKKTSILPNEILISFRYRSLRDAAWRGSFYKLIRRAATAKARLNFATLVRVSSMGMIEEARISIGSALPSPGRFAPAEELLKGEKPSRELLEAAAAACVDYMTRNAGRRWSSEYKEPVVRNVMRRELAGVLGLEARHAS